MCEEVKESKGRKVEEATKRGGEGATGRRCPVTSNKEEALKPLLV